MLRYELPEARAAIAAAGMDVLFYTDIGLDTLTYFLAFSVRPCLPGTPTPSHPPACCRRCMLTAGAARACTATSPGPNDDLGPPGDFRAASHGLLRLLGRAGAGGGRRRVHRGCRPAASPSRPLQKGPGTPLPPPHNVDQPPTAV